MDRFLKGLLTGNEYDDNPTKKWMKWEPIARGDTHCKAE